MSAAIGQVLAMEHLTLSSSGAVSTAGSITSSASGSGFLIVIRGLEDSFSSVTDNKSNTYTLQRKVQNTSDTDWLHIYGCASGTGGATHKATLTTTTGPNDYWVELIEITGGDPAAFFNVVSAGAFDSSSPFGDSATTTTANALVLGFFGGNGIAGTVTYTPGGSFTLVSGATYTDGTGGVSLGVAQLSVTSTGTYNPAFTVSSGGRGPVVTLAIKDLGGGGGSTSKSILLLGAG